MYQHPRTSPTETGRAFQWSWDCSHRRTARNQMSPREPGRPSRSGFLPFRRLYSCGSTCLHPLRIFVENSPYACHGRGGQAELARFSMLCACRLSRRSTKQAEAWTGQLEPRHARRDVRHKSRDPDRQLRGGARSIRLAQQLFERGDDGRRLSPAVLAAYGAAHDASLRCRAGGPRAAARACAGRDRCPYCSSAASASRCSPARRIARARAPSPSPSSRRWRASATCRTRA